jgi:N-acetylglutamate synthase-like GNAT family acetyltransferase
MVEQSQQVQIREMHIDETQAVLELIHRSAQELNARDYSPQDIETILKSYNPKEILSWKIAYVADLNTKIIGIAGANYIKGLYANIQGVFVDPQYLNQKIGARLLKRVEKEFTSLGIRKISVDSSLTAAGFYEKLGYQREFAETQEIAIIHFSKELWQESETRMIWEQLRQRGWRVLVEGNLLLYLLIGFVMIILIGVALGIWG